MKKYHLNFVNANGSMKSIEEVAGQLKKQLGGLSEAERIAALNAIFGSDAQRAASVLMNEGTAGIKKYIDATKKKGSAQELANARMKGTAGAIEAMRGSLETAGIALGESLLPTVAKLAAKAAELANTFAKWFNSLDADAKKSVLIFAAIIAAVGPLLVAIGQVVTAVGAIKAAFVGLKVASATSAAASAGALKTVLLPAIALVVAAFAGFAFGKYVLAEIPAVKEAMVNLGDWLSKQEWFNDLIGVKTAKVGGAWKGAAPKGDGVAELVRPYAPMANRAVKRVKGYATGGVATGPTSGYLAMLHGTELITPLGGASSRSRATERPLEVRVYLDGRELSRGLGMTALQTARSGVR
jgi:hypothetical protein